MSKGFNKTILLGNLTRDPETRTTQSGMAVTNLTLAVSYTYSKDGEQKENTSFINCVVWGKLGEIIAQYSKKGHQLLVSGRLEQRNYEDKEGNKRSAFEVVVDDFNFIGSKFETKPIDNIPEEIDDKPIDLNDIPF